MKSEVHSSMGHYPDALGAGCNLLKPGVDSTLCSLTAYLSWSSQFLGTAFPANLYGHGLTQCLALPTSTAPICHIRIHGTTWSSRICIFGKTVTVVSGKISYKMLTAALSFSVEMKSKKKNKQSQGNALGYSCTKLMISSFATPLLNILWHFRTD